MKDLYRFMNKQSAFNRFFREPVPMGGYGYALSAELYPTAEEAAAIFAADLKEDVPASALTRERVRFGFPPTDVECNRKDGPCWWGSASGKGSKPIWWYGE